MSAAVVDSVREDVMKTSSESVFDGQAQGEARESKRRFWPRISKIVTAMLTSLAKTAEASEYYLQADQAQRAQTMDMPRIRYGRVVPSPAGAWFSRSESDRFALAYQTRRLRDEIAYRSLPK